MTCISSKSKGERKSRPTTFNVCLLFFKKKLVIKVKKEERKHEAREEI
jgi:hypothetical protein